MDGAIPTETDTPPGFLKLGETEGFIGLAGPYYWRPMPSGAVDYGFAAEQRHGNPNGVLHGGSITTFMDTVLGYEVIRVTGRRCATIALNTQFLAGGRAGDWVTGRVTMRRLTGSMAFIDGEVLAAERLIATTTAIFRLFTAEGAPHLLRGGPPIAGG
jgi:uncharacterized protein (TIGR00369 family)